MVRLPDVKSGDPESLSDHLLGLFQLGLVHTMPDKFENATLGAKKEQKFSVHT